ncbi:MAG: DUF1343 domain-containing protein, partial [Chlorobaculum sp.]|nr:DUF1343 domain-containing protein [Chlorobaculum sp.]
SGAIRSMILDGAPAESIIASWEKDEAEFAALKPNFHLY